jgi:hypothetical protein
LDQYQHPSEPKFKGFNELYLKGVVDGLIAYSIAQNARDRFFCIPPTMAITVEQAEDYHAAVCREEAASRNRPDRRALTSRS